MYEGLLIQYDGKPDVELLLIAMNKDGSYSDDAIDAATTILRSRHKPMIDLDELWNEEISRLFELADRCSVCQREEVVYSKSFRLRGLVGLDDKWTAAGFIAGLVGRVGFVAEQYSEVQLQFRLCQQCLNQRLDKHGRLKISMDDYHVHPLCQLYKPLGLIEVLK